MEAYIDFYLNTEGEIASKIHKKLINLDLKPTIGEHDYIFNWKCIVNIEDEMQFIDNVQKTLKGTGSILKFKTIR